MPIQALKNKGLEDGTNECDIQFNIRINFCPNDNKISYIRNVSGNELIDSKIFKMIVDSEDVYELMGIPGIKKSRGITWKISVDFIQGLKQNNVF